MKTASSKLAPLLRQFYGPLTEELVLHPGEFGLGKVPARLAPDDTTDTVCGFCSTGCSLKAHLRNGSAINLSPASEYPVNLGMACPKGWEALEKHFGILRDIGEAPALLPRTDHTVDEQSAFA